MAGTAAAVALLISASPGNAVAQSTWDRYRPGTLASLITESDSTIRQSLIDQRPSRHFTGSQPTLATVIYKGESRPLDPIRRDFIREWGLSFQRDSSIAGEFHREYLFEEGRHRFWLPVQDAVASYFAKELQPGQEVRLFVMLLGGDYEKGAITWTFIVNEFKAGRVRRSD